jgi:hypothetical protein
MGEVIYVLCALTSIVSAALLLRSYAATRTRLLLWSSLCFVGLAANNVLLFVDLVVVPGVDLSLPRALLSFGAVALLNFGLIWDSK